MTVPSAWPFESHELPQQRSITGSLAVIEAGLAKKRLSKQRKLLRKSSQKEARTSQIEAGRRQGERD
jgi:hypothetical protein